MRWAVERGGPAFIKLAQWAAMRNDIFPAAMCAELGRLHHSARAHGWAATEAAMAAGLGAEWQELIALEREPVGSGCVAQVHRGTMLSGPDAGISVAVKVVHPATRWEVELDVDILRGLVGVLQLVPAVRDLGLSDAVEEFDALISDQMDMRTEVRPCGRGARGGSDRAAPAGSQPGALSGQLWRRRPGPISAANPRCARPPAARGEGSHRRPVQG